LELKALKQNLLEKKLRHKPPLVSENHHELLPQNTNIDFVVSNTDKLKHEDYGTSSQGVEDYNIRKQQLKEKRKQEMLEKNRY